MHLRVQQRRSQTTRSSTLVAGRDLGGTRPAHVQLTKGVDVTGIEDPIEYDITVRSDTDHEWSFRRLNADSVPLVPTEAKAEIRSAATRELWQGLDVTIAADGWIKIQLSRPFSDDTFWINRKEGEWDLLVTYGGKVYRWVEGQVTVDIGVTNYVL